MRPKRGVNESTSRHVAAAAIDFKQRSPTFTGAAASTIAGPAQRRGRRV